MKKFLALAIACMLIFGLCACVSIPTPSVTFPDKPDNKNEPTETAEAVDATTAPAIKNQVFKVGDTVKLNGIEITFISVTENKGSTYFKPADGKVYVLCEFEIVNNSDDELNVSSLLNFDAYCDDYSCDISISALAQKGNKEQLDGTVAIGKKMKGVVGYEIAKDWAELEIQYQPNILSNDKVTFLATNN